VSRALPVTPAQSPRMLSAQGACVGGAQVGCDHGGSWPPVTRAAIPLTLPSRVIVASALARPSTYRSKKASAIRLAGCGDLIGVQQAGKQIAGLFAQGKEPAEYVGHVLWLVHQVWLIRSSTHPTVCTREVHDRGHISGAGPGPQQVRVRVAALHESGGEHEQRERAADCLRS